MATSDSEDFESADEDWEEGTNTVKENLGQETDSANPNQNFKSPTVDISKETSSETVRPIDDENSISKSLENKVIIHETISVASAINNESSEKQQVNRNLKQVEMPAKENTSSVEINNEKLSSVSESDEKTKQSETHAKGDQVNKNLKQVEMLARGNAKVNNEKLSGNFESDPKTKHSEAHVKGDHSSDVKCAGEEVLPKEAGKEKEVKHSETLVKVDSKKSDEGQENLGLKPKDSSLETEIPVLEGETDGWDCEDDDLIDDLIEESSSNIQMDAVLPSSDEKEKQVSNDGMKERDSNVHMDAVLNKLSDSVEKEKQISNGGGSWGGWGSWGVTSLLSTATESVSTLTNQVSQGISTVLETGLGVPDPEELAKQQIEEEKRLLAAVKEKNELDIEEKKEEESSGLFGFGRVISGVSKLVETASTKVVTGGLDTLETIGKKTMEVLQEGDPGLRKKRAIFSDKVVLSQVLREAKDKAELEDKAMRNTEEARKVHFETLFDDYHGLVHLEALEMLSKQCNIKLQSVLINTPPADVADLQESIAEIKELCQLPDEEDAEGASFETLEEKLADVGKGLGVPVANQKLIKTWQEIYQWLQDCRNKQRSAKEETVENAEYSAPSAQEIHQKAIGTLARLTAEAVEQFHKTAELLLVYEKRNPCEEAKILLEMTSVFSLQISTAATVFSENLNTCSEYAEESDTVNSHITNVFLEAANSSSYIQEAFQLLIPVLQVGAVLS